MYLGIEIGGTKLQLGVGLGDGSPPVAFARREVDRSHGAQGILAEIERAAGPLISKHHVLRAAIGFGGPIDAAAGRVVRSHHVEGWERFPLADWVRDRLGVSATLVNDCDAAGLAEARFGAGRGRDPVLFVTVGTGIGGGLIVGGEIYRGHGAGAAEIGHLRPGLDSQTPDSIVESLAAGWGLEAEARRRLARKSCSVRELAEAASEGNDEALAIIDRGCQALGWAISQAITLTSPKIVVIGGGVSLMGERLFFEPVRWWVERYVFPPFVGTYAIVPAELREEVVVHGALAVARASNPTE